MDVGEKESQDLLLKEGTKKVQKEHQDTEEEGVEVEVKAEAVEKAEVVEKAEAEVIMKKMEKDPQDTEAEAAEVAEVENEVVLGVEAELTDLGPLKRAQLL
jgi:hypothetical protein